MTSISADVVCHSDFVTLESGLGWTQLAEPLASEWSDGILMAAQCNIPEYLLRSKLVLGVGVWLVSDASKKHRKGSYAWVIASDTDILCQNSGLIYAEVRSMTSYRAEAFGVLILVVFLRRLFEH